jgi:hypothetical protein
MAVKNYQNKHLKHEVYIEPTTVAHHKFVMRCADCGGAFIKWVKQAEAEFLMKDKK